MVSQRAVFPPNVVEPNPIIFYSGYGDINIYMMLWISMRVYISIGEVVYHVLKKNINIRYRTNEYLGYEGIINEGTR